MAGLGSQEWDSHLKQGLEGKASPERRGFAPDPNLQKGREQSGLSPKRRRFGGFHRFHGGAGHGRSPKTRPFMGKAAQEPSPITVKTVFRGGNRRFCHHPKDGLWRDPGENRRRARGENPGGREEIPSGAPPYHRKDAVLGESGPPDDHPKDGLWIGKERNGPVTEKTTKKRRDHLPPLSP